MNDDFHAGREHSASTKWAKILNAKLIRGAQVGGWTNNPR